MSPETFSRIVAKLQAFSNATIMHESDGRVLVSMSGDDYMEARRAIASLTDAERIEQVREVAIKLVLAIADHPGQNPEECVRLAPKSRAQLESSIRTITG